MALGGGSTIEGFEPTRGAGGFSRSVELAGTLSIYGTARKSRKVGAMSVVYKSVVIVHL
jgi:hypothetical protein